MGPSSDFAVESTVSIDPKGSIRFVGGALGKLHTAHNTTVSPKIFRDLAVNLGPYRTAPGRTRQLADKSTSWVSDVGNDSIVWTYADHRQGTITISNRRDDEVERVLSLIHSLDKLADPRWEREAIRDSQSH
jgi:autotransporter adhesin